MENQGILNIDSVIDFYRLHSWKRFSSIRTCFILAGAAIVCNQNITGQMCDRKNECSCAEQSRSHCYWWCIANSDDVEWNEASCFFSIIVDHSPVGADDITMVIVDSGIGRWFQLDGHSITMQPWWGGVAPRVAARVLWHLRGNDPRARGIVMVKASNALH